MLLMKFYAYLLGESLAVPLYAVYLGVGSESGGVHCDSAVKRSNARSLA